MPAKRKVKRLLFFDAKGHFVSPRDRYDKRTVKVMAFRGRQYRAVASGKITPEKLATVTKRDEFESLPAYFKQIGDYAPKARKYAAWDVAQQIDKARGIRRSLIRVTMNIRDGKRLRKVSFYHKIMSNQPSSYGLFQRMNDAIGAENMNFYKTHGGKMMADRRGKKVKLESVKVEKII